MANYAEIMEKINDLSAQDLASWLNKDGRDATAEQAHNVLSVLNDKIAAFNAASAKAVMDGLFSLSTTDFWRTYALDPHYNGLKLKDSPEDGYVLEPMAFRLKFKQIERAYQGDNKAQTLCAYKQWDIALRIFNHHLNTSLVESNGGTVNSVNSIDKAALEKALGVMPDFFQVWNKTNKVLMLKHLCNLICGEELDIKPMSFDVKYLALTISRAKYGSIKTISDWALMDEIVTVIGMCLDVDDKGKRNTLYDFSAKGGFYKKAKKAK